MVNPFFASASSAETLSRKLNGKSDRPPFNRKSWVIFSYFRRLWRYLTAQKVVAVGTTVFIVVGVSIQGCSE